MKKLLLILASVLAFCSSAMAAINLNTATQQELESLNGIGPAKAKAIMDYRTKQGPFKTVDELKNVPGIGDKTLEKLRKDIAVSGKSAAPTAKPTAPAKAGSSPVVPAKPGAKPVAKPVAPAKP
ncbi:competence protein ComEA helix-hairpin-helix repeat protein [Pseudogulbenkiania sp. NH8B]|uniref:ComEA family DNA-binding protein n=1 Tax=Pseudogulbenkiania sp. (strain NH8B) TaxID=748280 RepID=UPI000227A52A|nr:ComEA family DNA-binding protein [Pseudogulbenkiania sp. NH8B]BAK78268.1 competence protein ComEA helix-hairpin-helix repeat protein [Pseudogulbenkiania sp. NH8B]